MPISIHGKEYLTVAERINTFRKDHEANYSVQCEIISAADIVSMKASIINAAGFVVATGHAEEVRGSTNINKTSALENCETSAIGRALAFMGYGGTEIASANEVSDAIIQQAKMEVAEFFLKLNSCIVDNYESIACIKAGIQNGDLSEAKEAWCELGESVQMTLWVAPSKGGIFSTAERTMMKSNEWSAA